MRFLRVITAFLLVFTMTAAVKNINSANGNDGASMEKIKVYVYKAGITIETEKITLA